MKRILFWLILATLCSAVPATGKTLTSAAAIVNDAVITSYQLDKAVIDALAKAGSGDQLSSQQFDELKAQVLEQLVNEKLVEQRIEELGLTVSEMELNAAVQDVQRKNNLTEEMLKRAVEAQGMSFADYRDELRQEILRYRLLGREVNYKVQVTSNEVREYFREHIDEFRVQPKVRVSHVSFPVPTNITEKEMAALRQQVDVTRELLQNGEDFAQVMAAQDEDVSGGDMGELVEEELTEQFRAALVGLETGQVSEPVQMNQQIHLFLVTERNPGDANLFDRVKGDIEKRLEKEKTDARFKEWAQELRDRGYVELRI